MPAGSRFLGVVVVALFVIVYYFYELGVPIIDTTPRLEAQDQRQQVTAVERGYNLYEANCARCHGANGQGGIGPVLNDQAKLFAHLNEQYIKNVLTVGGRYVCGNPKSLMPVWADTNGGPLELPPDRRPDRLHPRAQHAGVRRRATRSSTSRSSARTARSRPSRAGATSTSSPRRAPAPCPTATSAPPVDAGPAGVGRPGHHGARARNVRRPRLRHARADGAGGEAVRDPFREHERASHDVEIRDRRDGRQGPEPVAGPGDATYVYDASPPGPTPTSARSTRSRR